MLNHVYRVIFNRSTGCYMAVSELAKSGGKSNRLTQVGTVPTSTTGAILRHRAIAVAIGGALGLTLGLTAVGAQAEVCLLNGNPTGGSSGNGVEATACGFGNIASNEASSALGFQNQASGVASSAIGSSNQASQRFSSAIGFQNNASAFAASAIGRTNDASGQDSSAIGSSNIAQGTNSSAIGFNNTAFANNSIAIGSNATANITNSVALGERSVTTVDAGVQGFGADTRTDATWQSTLAAVSVGNTSNNLTRQITGVAAGTADTDAVNVAQLKRTETNYSTALGGGASFGANGAFQAPTYRINKTDYSDVGSAFTAVDGRLTDLQGQITNIALTPGPKGDKGDKGETGPQGLAGSDGINGTNGIDGQNGTNGVDGINGQDGAQGPAGQNGTDGLNGTNGVDGINGQDGTSGVDGINGQDGADGAQGPAGQNGTDGLNGTNGVDGINGQDGTNGVDGISGQDGADGTNGKDGVDGAQGLTGQDGIDGAKGDKGDSGISEEAKIELESKIEDSQARFFSVNGSSDSEDAGNYNGNGATADGAIAIGVNAQSKGKDSIAIGTNNTVTGDQSTSVGNGNIVSGDRSGAFGDPNIVGGNANYAVGNDNIIGDTTSNSVVLGSNATVGATAATVDTNSSPTFANETNASNSVAIGESVNVQAANAVAIGANSSVTNDNSVALGAGSQTSADNTVSVGSATNQRRITNVAAGVDSHDAVNLAQSQAGDSQTLDTANDYTNQRFATIDQNLNSFRGDVDSRFKEQDQRIDKVGAMSAAIQNMGTSVSGMNQRNRIGLGMGFQGGEQAVAIGYQRVVSDNTSLTFSGAFSDDESSAGVGVGFGW